MLRPPTVLSALILGATLAAVHPPAARAQTEARTLVVAGMKRSYLLYRPAGTVPPAGMPLVLVFHGGSGTARGIARHTGWTDAARRDGFAVVYPQGIGRRWNDGRGIHTAYDDVGFVRALLDTVRRELPIDARRIYATGISNGAVFVHRLACELPGAFAAIAPVAGAFPARLSARCGGTPVGVVAFNGTADRLMPYRGVDGVVLSAETSVARWAAVNGCAAATDSLFPERAPADGTRVREIRYTGCRRGRDVVLYRIQGGGHTWPGGPAAGAAVGRVSREIDATAVIRRFFARAR